MSTSAQLHEWQLENTAAEAYERYLVPAIFQDWAEDLVDLVEVRPGERVLDLACGTGIVARLAAPRVGPAGKVVGVDINADMLAVARTASSKTRPAIDWLAGDAHSVPLPDDSVEVTLCQFAFMFFADRLRALTEMRRVTVPDGRIAVSVWRRLADNPAYALLADALEGSAGADAATMMRSPFAFGDIEALRTLARDAGLRDARIRLCAKVERYPSVQEMVRREAASSPLAGPLAALEPARRVALMAEAANALRSYVDDDGVALPVQAYVLTARA